MDEPVRRRLRPARRHGLTSPDPVTASLSSHRPLAGHPTIPGTDPPDKPQKSERQISHARRYPQDQPAWPGRRRNDHLNSRGGSRLRPTAPPGFSIAHRSAASDLSG
jgi:hypothetical protein